MTNQGYSLSLKFINKKKSIVGPTIILINQILKKLSSLGVPSNGRYQMFCVGGVALTVDARCHLVTIMSLWIRISPGAESVSYLCVFHS